jgi:ribonuclease BN (tRNA processing enzyme)
VKLTIVGAAAAYTQRPGRSSSCYLVEHASTSIVLDIGQGSFSELWRYASWRDIAAVFVSHMHADHNVDLIALRHWVKYQNHGYGPALYGPAELRPKIAQYQGADTGFLSDLHGEALSPRTFTIGDLRVTAGRVTHIPDSFGFRVAPASSRAAGLVYSGDCSVADDLLPLIVPGDTLLCEAGFGAGAPDAPIHLTAQAAAGVGARAGARNLILTHILEGRDPEAARAAAAALFDGPVSIAEPGLEVDIR